MPYSSSRRPPSRYARDGPLSPPDEQPACPQGSSAYTIGEGTAAQSPCRAGAAKRCQPSVRRRTGDEPYTDPRRARRGRRRASTRREARSRGLDARAALSETERERLADGRLHPRRWSSPSSPPPAPSCSSPRSAPSSTPRPSPTGCCAPARRLCLPRILAPRHMAAFRVTDLAADLAPGKWGIPEPREGMPQVPPEAMDLVFVPGSAFDEDRATAAATAAASTTTTCRCTRPGRPGSRWPSRHSWCAHLLRTPRPAGDRHRHRAAGDQAGLRPSALGEVRAETPGLCEQPLVRGRRTGRVRVAAAGEHRDVAVRGQRDVAAQRVQRLLQTGLGGDCHQPHRLGPQPLLVRVAEHVAVDERLHLR